MHDAHIGGRSENNINDAWRSPAEEPNNSIFCHVTVFTSDFLSFIVVEHIRFFHGALSANIWTDTIIPKK